MQASSQVHFKAMVYRPIYSTPGTPCSCTKDSASLGVHHRLGQPGLSQYRAAGMLARARHRSDAAAVATRRHWIHYVKT